MDGSSNNDSGIELIGSLVVGDNMYLGIACTGHDNALALVDEHGKVLYAQASERDYQSKQAFGLVADQPRKVAKLIKQFAPDCTRVTICKSWPDDTRTRMAAEIEKIDVDDVDDYVEQYVAEGLKQELQTNMESIFLPNIAIAGGGTKRAAADLGIETKTYHFDHHACHAAFACYSSPFDQAVCLVVDGYSEDSAQSVFLYDDNALEKLDLGQYHGKLNRLAASLGVYYGVTICRLCGFETNAGEEWKIMGLAPYGKVIPELLTVLRRYISVEDGVLFMPDSSATAHVQLAEYRCSYDEDADRCADLAHTAQVYFGELMDQVLAFVHDLTGCDNLVLSGGCALNSSYNGSIIQNTAFKDVFIPCAPGDDGNAVGAALLGVKRDTSQMQINNKGQNPYLGDEIDETEVADFVSKSGFTKVEKMSYPDLYEHVATAMSKGKIVAWTQGRAEFGPRALGNRSILADPRTLKMKAKINKAVKFREPFRPFAPIVLAEQGEAYFEHYHDTPYMEKVLVFKEAVRSQLEAVCHADNTGRAQSITLQRNEHLYRLIQAFEAKTGVPVILNTSLNVMGKPIVSSMNDIVMTFLTTDLDLMVMGQYVFHK
jgi:carbamoyltransferase